MPNANDPDTCLCGHPFGLLELSATNRHPEVPCPCGCRTLFESAGMRLRPRATLTSEGSVPLRGFSKELRMAEDVERYWFVYPIGGAALPVHIMFSRSWRIAEVKAADMKALRLEEIESASEACRIWIEKLENSRRRLRPSAANRLTGIEPRVRGVIAERRPTKSL